MLERELWKQYFGYGYWKVKIFQKHPHQMKLRQFIPFLFLSSLLITFIGLLGGIVPAALFFFPLVLYIMACFYFGLKAARANQFNRPHLIATSFVIIHLSYGLGFACGLLGAFTCSPENRK